MEFEDIESDGIEPDGAANAAETEQDARDATSRERIAEKDEAHQLELSGIGNRPERFGVGPTSKGQVAARGDRSGPGTSFHAAAMAQAYAQPVTFSAGGRDVSMSLGDLRTVASDRYNHYASQIRQLREQGAGPEKIRAAQQRRYAYGDLIRIADEVAAGNASPEAINDHIEKHEIGQEIVDTAMSNPDVEATYHAPEAAETTEAGVYTDQSAEELNADFVGSFFRPS